MHDFDVFNECVTERQTNRPTDKAYYRDARTHLKSKVKNETDKEKEQVTRGHNIIRDGWAGESNPHPHPNHTSNPLSKHSHTNNTNCSIISTRFSRFQPERDNSSVTDQRTDGRTDGRTKPLIELRVRN